MTNALSSIGREIDRQDGRLKITGKARYAAEFRSARMAHAVLIQSTVAAGRMAETELAAARVMAGIIDIITPDNAPHLHGAGPALLQSREIFFNGQNISVVVAETLQQAQAAAAMVRQQYAPGDAVTTMAAHQGPATKPTKLLNDKFQPDSQTGDPRTAVGDSVVTVTQVYTTPVEHHNPMEPHATVAQWTDGRLTVWTATQAITWTQQALAGLFGLSPAHVTVICPFVGGGFGCKGVSWPPVALAALAAKKIGRPVKLEVTRPQMFTSNGFRSRTVQTVLLAAAPGGALIALRHDSVSQGAIAPFPEFVESSALAARMLYACPSISTSHRLRMINQGPPTFMRGPGETPGLFALESAMDELAVKLDMDPVALRLRNHTDHDATTGLPFASKALRQCYAQGATAFGWHRRTAKPRSMQDGAVLIGMGMATSTYPTSRMPASAMVRMMPDGSALVRSGTQDIGTGTYTTMAQVAGDVLGLPVERVRVELGDSRLPPAPVSGGSMTSASVLPAVHSAAINARQALLALVAAHPNPGWRGIAPQELRLENGIVLGPAGRLSVNALLTAASVEWVDGTDDAKPAGDSGSYAHHAFGAQFAEVRIDRDVGTLKISHWVGAFDCGKLINPKTARSQLLGGIIFGIGMALMEETVIDAASGRIVNANIAEYLMPVNADIPDIQTIVVDGADMITTQLGIKGIGELPTVGAAAAIANAVYHATGVRVRDLPIRLETLLG